MGEVWLELETNLLLCTPGDADAVLLCLLGGGWNVSVARAGRDGVLVAEDDQVLVLPLFLAAYACAACMYLDVPLGARYDPCLDNPAIPLSELMDLDLVTPALLGALSTGAFSIPYPDGVRGRVLMGDGVGLVFLLSGLRLFSGYKAVLLLFLLNVPLLLFLLNVLLLLFRLILLLLLFLYM